MSRSGIRIRPLPLVMVTLMLQACQRPGAAEPIRAATPAPASAPQGAANDTPAALMAQAFEGWTSGQPHVVDMPAEKGADEKTSRVLVSPTQVITLDDDHRALVVTGPLDGGGEPVSGHAVGASVSVYGFERRGGRWFKTFERAAITWTGFYGEAGSFKVHPVGPGRVALSIENGSCWQGYCGHWVEVFALGATDARPLFNQRTSTSSTGATEGCTEWLEGKKLAGADDTASISATNCFDVNGKWRFEPAGDSGWPDVVLTFTGAEATQEKEDTPPVLRAVEEQLVLRHDGTAYKPVRGRNPTHDL